MIFLYVTCKDEKEAERIAETLLNKKLVACTNFFPIRSMYWWKGKIEDGNEFVLILKTKKESYKKVNEEIKKIHSYTIPFIGKIDVEANKEYVEWLNGVVKWQKKKLQRT